MCHTVNIPVNFQLCYKFFDKQFFCPLSCFVGKLSVTMENNGGHSDLVPVRTPPVNTTEPGPNSNIVATAKNFSVTEATHEMEITPTDGGEPVNVEFRAKEAQGKVAAIAVEECPDGDGYIVKGASAEVVKREVAIRINGEEVLCGEVYYAYMKAFETRIRIRREQKAIGAPDDEPPQYTPSAFERTVYRCCQAYTCDCKSCRGFKKENVRKSYEDPESLKEARPIGFDLIRERFMNFLALSLLGEAFLYFTLIFTSVEFILSLVSLITNFTSDQNDQILEIISFVLSVLGTGFSYFDFGLHFRHRGCRIFKRTCKGEDQEQEQDEEHKEFCNDTCCSKSDEQSCGNRCVSVLDVIRIFVLETIYYPDFLSAMFDFIDELINNNHNAKQIPATSWLSFIWSMLLIVVTVYCAKIHTLWGLVYSMKELRIRKKGCQGILFIVTFALYMLGLLILQMLMIAVIGGRYHHDFTAGPGIISGQLWYMMVCGYLMPVFGMAIFFVVHHFWTMKLPLDLIFDFIKMLQTEGIEAENTKKDELDRQKIIAVTNHIDNFEGDYNNLQKIHFSTKFGYPFSSPLHIVLTSIYSAMLFVFCLCSLIGGPNSGPWVLFYLLSGLLGTLVNMYALAVFFVWLFFVLSILVGILMIIAVILLCLFLASFGSSNSSNNRR